MPPRRRFGSKQDVCHFNTPRKPVAVPALERVRNNPPSPQREPTPCPQPHALHVQPLDNHTRDAAYNRKASNVVISADA